MSVVGDSYNIYRFCEKISSSPYLERILARDGVFVVRPDSDDPLVVIEKCLRILAKGFGTVENIQGYKELPPQIKLLWGDGLDLIMIGQILNIIVGLHKWSMSNIATFGMGGGLLQRVHRDTQRFAFKCSAQKRNNVWHDIYKDPLDKSKTSKRGALALVYGDDGKLTTVPEHRATENDLGKDQLQTVYENGHMQKYNDLVGMRKRCEL